MSTFVSFKTTNPEGVEFFDVAGSRMNGTIRLCMNESTAFFNADEGRMLLTTIAEAIAYAEAE